MVSLHSPEEWIAFCNSNEGDLFIAEEIDRLRARVEPTELWLIVRDEARKELSHVPSHVLLLIVAAYHDFLVRLPSIHGIGHLVRDLIYSLRIFQDDQVLAYCDEVELFLSGLGMFLHDTGNIFNRNLDGKCFAPHAEKAAFMAGVLLKDILPSNLLMMLQLIIAAHTNLLTDVLIKRSDGCTRLLRTYQSSPQWDGTEYVKLAFELVKRSDRLDTRGSTLIVREMLAGASQIVGFTEGRYHDPLLERKADFIHKYDLLLRSKEYRDSLLTSQERTRTIAEHFVWLLDTAFNSPYSQFDSPYYRYELMFPQFLQMNRVTHALLSLPPAYSDEHIHIIMEKFIKLCILVEPAFDTSPIDNIRQFFPLLDREYQWRWVYAIEVLFEEYEKWYSNVSNFPDLISGRFSTPVTECLMDMRKVATVAIDCFHPAWLDRDANPNLFSALYT